MNRLAIVILIAFSCVAGTLVAQDATTDNAASKAKAALVKKRAKQVQELTKSSNEGRAELLTYHLNETLKNLKTTKKSKVKRHSDEIERDNQGVAIQYPTAKSKREEIAKVQASVDQRKAEIDAVKTAREIVWPNLYVKKVGDWGKGISGGIIQVIDDRTMLVDIQNPYNLKVISIMIKGVATEGLTDNSKIGDETNFFEVTGTTSYTTVLGGSKTVFVVEMLNMAPIHKALGMKQN